MDWNLRELRYFVTALDVGSFTDAARELHVSQAAVSRTIASLERTVGDRVLRRIPRGCEPTATGQQILPHARRVLSEADRFSDFLRSRQSTLRLGYAWAGLGRHTAALQRTWARDHPDIELELVKRNTPTAGLVEGACDVAVLRRTVEDSRLESVVVGLERRVVAFASDDPQWARRRRLSMAELAERTILIDSRTGSTTGEMWAGLPARPTFVESSDVDQWLDAIAAGKAVGTTAEATGHHHVRPGVSYRPVKDGPRIPVRLVWWRDDRPRGLVELVDVVTRLYAGSR
ncbi:MAG: LysR family transcriptional regulator [Dermatophilaceae bacterium]